ncbi:MAG: DNA polymerase III subunit delta' [Brumimicrobium sp.]|nr:DNA polymerase III subunit delta' [Brumimicrobium sp.]
MLFKEVIGQEALKERLRKELEGERISHAQLFLGKTGYGSLPLALAFIQYLFCENRSSEDSCGTCSSCNKMMTLQHPDVHFSFPTVQAVSKTSDPQFKEWKEMALNNPYFSLNQWIYSSDPKGRNPVISKHQSEEIVKKLALKSYEGGYKVSVIWMADEMNTVCANKLLKIIEEPPAKTLFILIAEKQEEIMPTILSRTQLVKIKQIEEVALEAYLKKHGIGDQDTLKSILSRAEGDLMKAIEMATSQGNENENRERFIELMRICYKKEVLPMLDWAEKTAKLGREEQKNFLEYALFMIRQSLMNNYTEEQLVRASPEETAFLKKFSRFITGNNVLDFTKLFNDAHYHVVRNAHAKILFTNITFEVMRYIHRA